MIEEGVIENMNMENIFEYMGELLIDKDKYNELQISPKKTIKNRLGIEINSNVSVKKNYTPLSKEDIKLVKEIVNKDMNGTLSNEFLESASNRLAVLIAVAAVAAAAWLVLWVVGPD